MRCYYYLHENGSLIVKPVDFEPEVGGFVRAVWGVDTAYRETAWIMLIESLALGADRARVFEIAVHWGCDDGDALSFVAHGNAVGAARMNLERIPDGWRAYFSEDGGGPLHVPGEGPTALDALADMVLFAEERGGRREAREWPLYYRHA